MRAHAAHCAQVLRLVNKDCDCSPPVGSPREGLTQCVFGTLRRFTPPPRFIKPSYTRLSLIVFCIQSNFMVNQRLVKSHEAVLEKILPAKGAAQRWPRHQTQKGDPFSILL